MQAALAGKRVVAAGSQGKYFWLELDSPPHPVMHLGMTGWVHIRGVPTAYNRYAERMSGSAEKKEAWPPKYWKFHFTTEGGEGDAANKEAEEEKEGKIKQEGEEEQETNGAGKGEVSVAFTDSRRFGRVRLVDCAGGQIRSHTPLVENGPDPVQDRARFTEAYLLGKMRGRHVPVKALLLDQAMISGIGNWVGDEILYQAGLHPAQYSDDFTAAEVARLYAAVCAVCDTAVGCLGASDRFPSDWLFQHRWGKGKKDAPKTLPTGEEIVFLEVGGRTSCVVPSRQKKTGSVASDAKMERKGRKIGKKNSRFFDEDKDSDDDDVKEEEEEEEEETKKVQTKAKARPAKKLKSAVRKVVKEEEEKDRSVLADGGDSKLTRRSERLKLAFR